MKIVRKTLQAGLAIACLMFLSVNAQVPPTRIIQTLREKKMFLVDLRNDGYEIAFPEDRNRSVPYTGMTSSYLYSIVAPSGRSLFAMRSALDPRKPPVDTLIRRSIAESVGPEEVLSLPFSNFSLFNVSPNERFMVIAGRLADLSLVNGKRDGIFLLDRSDDHVDYVAPYSSSDENQAVRSLNVSNRGDILYEDRGAIVRIAKAEAGLTPVARHSGEFPALMQDGRSYVYADHGWLMMSDAKGMRELLRVPKILGAIRLSPDGRHVAFGVGAHMLGRMTQLRICDLNTKSCVDGPSYADWIAGRETFWIKAK